MPVAATTLLGGREGVFKTYLALELCYARSSKEGKFLGQFPVKQGLTLYLDGENGQDVMHERIKGMRLDAAEYPLSFYVIHMMGTPLSKDTAPKLMAFCEKHHIDLVICDPYRQLLDGNQNEIDDVTEFTRILSQFHAKGIATLILPHERKAQFGDHSSEPTTDNLSGFGGLKDHASAVLQLQESPGVGVKVTHTKTRRGSKHDPFSIKVEQGPICPIFSYGGSAISEDMAERQKIEVEVMEYLQDGGKMRQTIIETMEARKYRLRNINSALSSLKVGQQVVAQRRGKEAFYLLPEHTLMGGVERVQGLPELIDQKRVL